MFKVLAAAILAAFLAACTSSMSGDYAEGKTKTLLVHKGVWDGFQEYMRLISATNPGAFAVQVDHDEAFGYSGWYCPAGHCIAGKDSANSAMSECRSHGSECILFARGSDILVNYRLLDN
jgi:hypothetical protein